MPQGREYFRAMIPSNDGFPERGRSGRKLGVRVPEDVRPDGNGAVHPKTGGMSVAPDSIWNVPHHRRPRGLGRGSTGHGGDIVYAIHDGDLRGPGLTVRSDPLHPTNHALVEPSRVIPLAEYDAAIESTRPTWRRAWP